jgi:hypothetical protein
MRRLWLVAGLALLCGCPRNKEPSPEELNRLGSALTKLSAAVEATARYRNPPAGTSDSALLALSTQHDPVLLRPFAGYKLLARAENRHGLVLVCTADGKRALFEDAGCTGRLDASHWQASQEVPCQFTAASLMACAKPGQAAPAQKGGN